MPPCRRARNALYAATVRRPAWERAARPAGTLVVSAAEITYPCSHNLIHLYAGPWEPRRARAWGPWSVSPRPALRCACGSPQFPANVFFCEPGRARRARRSRRRSCGSSSRSRRLRVRFVPVVRPRSADEAPVGAGCVVGQREPLRNACAGTQAHALPAHAHAHAHVRPGPPAIDNAVMAWRASDGPPQSQLGQETARGSGLLARSIAAADAPPARRRPWRLTLAASARPLPPGTYCHLLGRTATCRPALAVA